MSNINDITDKIRSVIPTLSRFTSKSIIPYPYALENNPSPMMRDAWALVEDESVPRTATDNPEYTLTSNIGITLTRRVANVSSDRGPLIDQVKEMNDDIEQLLDNFTGNRFTAQITFIDKVEFVNVVSITGIDNVVAGNFNHITKTVVFGITHWK